MISGTFGDITEPLAMSGNLGDIEDGKLDQALFVTSRTYLVIRSFFSRSLSYTASIWSAVTCHHHHHHYHHHHYHHHYHHHHHHHQHFDSNHHQSSSPSDQFSVGLNALRGTKVDAILCVAHPTF